MSLAADRLGKFKGKALGRIMITQRSGREGEITQMMEDLDICDASPELWPDAVHQVEAALHLLVEYAPAFRTVIESVHVIVALGDGRNRADGASFSSTSFGRYPGCIYLSSSAKYFLPPRTCLASLSCYALAENLYHEALHQELFRNTRTAPLAASDEDAVRIYVPWRQSEWTPSHALHAAYVYAHLYQARSFLGRAHIELWEELAEEARAAADTLACALSSDSKTLSVRGRLVLRRIVGLLK